MRITYSSDLESLMLIKKLVKYFDENNNVYNMITYICVYREKSSKIQLMI